MIKGKMTAQNTPRKEPRKRASTSRRLRRHIRTRCVQASRKKENIFVHWRRAEAAFCIRLRKKQDERPVKQTPSIAPALNSLRDTGGAPPGLNSSWQSM